MTKRAQRQPVTWVPVLEKTTIAQVLYSQLQGIFRRKREVDAYRQYLAAHGAANSKTESQSTITWNSAASREYMGYTIFGQHPGEVSRQLTPEASTIPRGGRHRYESRHSTPGVRRNITFQSRRSPPGPQSDIRSNRRGRNNGPM